MQKVRHPMVRGEAGGRDNRAGDSPMGDVFAKSRSQVVERFLLAFGHLDYVDTLRISGSKITQSDKWVILQLFVFSLEGIEVKL